jgi:hypothetical protein
VKEISIRDTVKEDIKRKNDRDGLTCDCGETVHKAGPAQSKDKPITTDTSNILSVLSAENSTIYSRRSAGFPGRDSVSIF